MMSTSLIPKSWSMAILAAVMASMCVGCMNETAEQRREREERLRQETAEAAAKAKPALENAGKELNRAADRAADDAKAAAQGIKEGWNSASGNHAQLDLNSATENELLSLPGIDRREAHRIVDGRPYVDKHELVTKRILTEDEYLRIRDQIAAK